MKIEKNKLLIDMKNNEFIVSEMAKYKHLNYSDILNEVLREGISKISEDKEFIRRRKK